MARAEKKALQAYRPKEITREFLSYAIEIREGGPSKGFQYVEELLRAEEQALVVKEDLMGVEGPLPVEGCSGCQRVRITVRDCLKPISPPSRSFGLSVHLNQGLFRDEEKAEVSVFPGGEPPSFSLTGIPKPMCIRSSHLTLLNFLLTGRSGQGRQ